MQGTLFPDHLEDFVGEDNAVRVIDAFIDALDLVDLGFEGAVPATTGRPGYHPAVLLKIYVYGYLRSEEHTSELQSLMRISYAVFCLKKKKHINRLNQRTQK